MWPWRRTRQPAAEPAAPAPWSRGEWQTLPPIQRVLPDHPLINPVQRFTATLTSWSSPSYLEPLGHRIGPAEPSGVVAGLITPVQRAAQAPVTPIQRAAQAPDLPVAQPPRRQAGGFWSRLLAATVQRTAEPSDASSRRDADARHQVERQPGPAEQVGGDVGHVNVFERGSGDIAATTTAPLPSSDNPPHGETGSASQADLSQPAPGAPGSVTISKPLDVFAAPAVSVPVVRPLQRTVELVTAKPVDLPLPQLPAIPAAEVPATLAPPTISTRAESPAESPAEPPGESLAEPLGESQAESLGGSPGESQGESPAESLSLAESPNGPAESPADPDINPVLGLDSFGATPPLAAPPPTAASQPATPLAAPPPAAANRPATPHPGTPTVQRAGSPSATSRRLGLGAPIIPAEARSESSASAPEAPFLQRSLAKGPHFGDQGQQRDVGSPGTLGGSEQTASDPDAMGGGPRSAGLDAASAFGAAVPTLQTSIGENAAPGGTSVTWQPGPDPAIDGDDTARPAVHGQTPPSRTTPTLQRHPDSASAPTGQPDHGLATTLGSTPTAPSHGLTAELPDHDSATPYSGATPDGLHNHDSATSYGGATPGEQPNPDLATLIGDTAAGPTYVQTAAYDATATARDTAPDGLLGHGSTVPSGSTAQGEQRDPYLATLTSDTAAGLTYLQTGMTATAHDTTSGTLVSHGLAATLGSVAAAGQAGPGAITVARAAAASPTSSPAGTPATPARPASQGRLLPSPPERNGGAGGGQPLAVSYGQTASHGLVGAPLAIQRTGPLAIQRAGSYVTQASPNGIASVSMPLGVTRPAVQRQESGTAAPPAEPPPEPPPSESAAPELAAGPDTAPATAPEAQAGAQTGQAQPAASPADADELVKKLFDPLLHRLKAELRLDRERRGKLTDLRH